MGYFKDVKDGDRAWSITYGWGDIVSFFEDCGVYNMIVIFDSGHYGNYADGVKEGEVEQTLFWDEIKFKLPPKPKNEVKHNDEYWVLVDYYGNIGFGYNTFNNKQEAEEFVQRIELSRYIYPAKIKKEWSTFE